MLEMEQSEKVLQMKKKKLNGVIVDIKLNILNSHQLQLDAEKHSTGEQLKSSILLKRHFVKMLCMFSSQRNLNAASSCEQKAVLPTPFSYLQFNKKNKGKTDSFVVFHTLILSMYSIQQNSNIIYQVSLFSFDSRVATGSVSGSGSSSTAGGGLAPRIASGMTEE